MSLEEENKINNIITKSPTGITIHLPVKEVIEIEGVNFYVIARIRQEIYLTNLVYYEFILGYFDPSELKLIEV